MIRTITIVCLCCTVLPVMAQQQQAGNSASVDTEGTFQALIDTCDNVDVLMLRARIRLQLPRTTEDAAAQAEDMLEQGFATCGSGDIEGAKSQLTEALAIAEQGAAQKFSVEETAQTDSAVAEQESSDKSSDSSIESAKESKPWWKFW